MDARGELLAREALTRCQQGHIQDIFRGLGKQRRWETVAELETKIIQGLVRGSEAGTEIWSNISWVSLSRGDWVEGVMELINGRPWGFELTEECWGYGKDLSAVRRNVDWLRNQGIRMILDDFGERNNNVDVLYMGWDVVKVSGRLIKGYCQEGRWGALASICRCINAHGALAIAEWVESPQQWLILQELGFSGFQGYWISRHLRVQRLSC